MTAKTSPSPYDRVTHDGHTVDRLTHLALLEAEVRLGYPLNLTQGSYSTDVAASGGTHDGGGTLDAYPRTPADAEREELELRRVGFAAWIRPELWRNGVLVWKLHIHAVQIGNRRLSSPARDQVTDYLAGRNGLANGGPDTGPRQFVDRRFTWRTGSHRITRARLALERAQAMLATGTRGYRLRKAERAIREALAALPRTGDRP